MMTIRCLILLCSACLLLAGCKRGPAAVAEPPAATQRITIARQIALAYGLEDWDQVERIDFTYHEEAADRQVQRRWTWEPKNDWVTLHGDARGGSVSYQTRAMSPDVPAEIAQAHAWFMHDRRRLLLPLDLIWSNAQVNVEGTAALPSGQGQALRVTVAFAKPDGTTQQGELFVDDTSYRIRETLHPTPAGATIATRWGDHMHIGPIVIAMRRVGVDGTVTRFSDVRVKVKGDDRLLTPTPAASF